VRNEAPISNMNTARAIAAITVVLAYLPLVRAQERISYSNPGMQKRYLEEKARHPGKEWQFYQTQNYLVASDLSGGENKEIGAFLQSELEKARGCYMFFYPPPANIPNLMVVKVFEKRESYNKYVGAGKMDSRGWALWDFPHRKEVVINFESVRDSYRGSESEFAWVANHEGFHLYFFYNIWPNLPLWFNEGNACLFGSQRRSGDSVTFVKQAANMNKLSDVQDEIKGGELDLRKLVAMDYRELNGMDSREVDRTYSRAWGLVYFLMHEKVHNRRSPYANILDAFYRTIVRARNKTAANTAAFSGVNWRNLQNAYVDFWTGPQSGSKVIKVNLR
jgi:hypothetical protein